MNDTQTIATSAYLRSHVGRVCVAVQGRTVDELLENAENAASESHFLELRLDSLKDQSLVDNRALESFGRIARFLAAHKESAFIATFRRSSNGGGFAGTLHQELDVLNRAIRSGFSIIDLEIESAEECSSPQFETLCQNAAEFGASLILSYHDFRSASDPETAFQRIQRFSPDLVKIVSTAHTLTDSLNLIRWIKQRSGGAQIVAIAMGEFGILSRLLSLRAGSAFTFAATADGAQSAPGQMTVRTLHDLYRIEHLDQATRVYGVAGNPVAHSLSPLMQNTAFHRERVNAVYLPLKTDSLEDLLHLARSLPLSGVSVTMPHKQAIMAHLANVDPMTAKIGACNTIRTGADGKLYGFNTDVAGIVRPLEKRLALKGARILVLGSGGAARAAVFGLAEKGARVSIWSRNESKCHHLAKEANVEALTRTQIKAADLDVLINATPCGMHGNPHPLPLESNDWNARLVFDLVYNPLDTPLLAAAKTRGISVIQGVEMFVQQGVRQFELWTGKPAPEAEMLRVVLNALHKVQVLKKPAEN